MVWQRLSLSSGEAGRMTWLPTIADTTKPKYLALVEVLERDIATGSLRHGDRLPPQRVIAQRLDITIATITKAFREAARRGIVTARTGSGTFVRVGEEIASDERPGPDLSLNTVPSAPSKPFLDAALEEVGGRRASELLCSYESAMGSEPHRAGMAKWLRKRGLPVSPAEVIVTHGGQHALAACFQALTRPGDTILCEEWTYTGIRRLAELNHVKVRGVAMDGEGLEPASLKAKLKATGAKVVICNPCVQNPTTTTMSLARRLEVAEICAAESAWLIEDDIYGVLAGDDVPPIAALDREHVVHFGSVSKCIAPGMRLGTLVAPDNLLPSLANALVSLQWTAPTFWVETFLHMLDNGLADRCVAAHRKEAARRMALFDEVIGFNQTTTDFPSYHVWHAVPSPWRADDLAAEVQSVGVRVSPAQHFAAEPIEGRRGDYIRVCLGGGDDTDLLRMQLIRLKTVMQARPLLTTIA